MTKKSTTTETRVLTGNDALAEAMRQINPDVVAAYPITPTSYIVETFSQFVADGAVETEFVTTESEHSAMSACVGAAASGVRAMTATASQGLALMHEVLINAAGLRLPIVLLNGNRALSAPLSIHGDHSDAMSERDSGWIQLYAKHPQEAYDLALQAFPIAELSDVRTPVMVCFDAFDVTHMVTNVMVVADSDVREFIGPLDPVHPLLDFEHPVSYGTYTNPNFYFEHRKGQHEGIESARAGIIEVGEKFTKLTGRDYTTHIETIETADAEVIIVIAGAYAGVVEETVKKLRANGEKVGVLRIRTFRPFPASEVAEALQHAKYVAVLDRTLPAGATGGPIFNEVNSALFMARKEITTQNFIYGLGGREMFVSHVEELIQHMKNGTSQLINFVNVRE